MEMKCSNCGEIYYDGHVCKKKEKVKKKVIMDEIHECEILKNTDVEITIEKINNQWLWVYHQREKNPVAHGIKYCPYCGVELIK